MKTDWIEDIAGFDGVRVQVRVRRSWSGQQRVDGSRTVVRDSDDGRTKEAAANFLEFGIAVFEASIVSWAGVHDEAGNPLPHTRAGFLHDDFDPDLGDALVDRLEMFYAARERSPAEVKTDAASSTES